MSDTQQRIDAIVKGHPIVLFMKGDANFPMCGFSGRAIQVLKAAGMDLHKLVTVNVLGFLHICRAMLSTKLIPVHIPMQHFFTKLREPPHLYLRQ